MRSAYLCLVTFLCCCFFQFCSCKTHPADVTALKNIKASVVSSSKQLLPSSCIASWDFSSDPCDSGSSQNFVCGFSCDGTNSRRKRIIRLELDAAGYGGTLSPSIGDLSSLIVLDLSQNFFTGKIPAEIGKLTNLQKLDLSRNQLSGRLPESISQLPRLEYLSVSENNLSGKLPVSLFNSLKNLQRLYLQKNRFSGALPTSLSSSVNLRYLDASDNAFTDNSALSRLPKSLFQLSLRGNAISWKLDGPEITKLQNLEVLDLSRNKISGAIASNMFQLPNLQQLNLSRNQLSSIKFDDRLNFSQSRLVAFDASHNKIRGHLPVTFSKFSMLSSLSLSNNFFTDKIPEEYATKVASTGSIVGGVPVLPLTRLFLDANYLQGDLPKPFLQPLPNLISASFSYNCLKNCPSKLSFCQGSQRPKSQCQSH